VNSSPSTTRCSSLHPLSPHAARPPSAGSWPLVDGSCAREPIAGAPPIVIEWDPAPARLVERPLEDPMLTRSWGERLTRLDIDVTGLSSLTVRVAAPSTDRS